uniref:ABC transporter domain-containing protein n=1 Tax=Esox lucius TaxID=8010 RepID=A0A6Q2XRP9_ESOLU
MQCRSLTFVISCVQMQTKRSVWSELDHLRVVMMGQPGSVEVQKFPHALISIYLVLAFTPFVTFLIVNVAAEKEHRLKDTMSMMGLYDSAFWLSWGLLYAALVTTMSILMSIIATYTALFPNSDFIVIFLLIFLYGISSVSTSEEPWSNDDMELISLVNISPLKFGMRRSLFYFLKPSYWSKRSKHYVEVSSVYDTEVNGVPGGAEPVEPISPEFRGKEAIRINNIHKVYQEKDGSVEALRGLTFDIYEGQITALLGHSGAGKSTLMNILCGICPQSDGHASIYGSPVTEIADGAEMRQLVGICPQFNIVFDVLTVEEHLRIFAAIKGIRPEDVTKVLKDLDLEKIMSAQAKNLSGGQKRKLSIGIAILGDPKILLLDEPTAGMDPCSRHQVWSLLKNRKAGRVIVLTTHYMDEADILADRKAVISHGQLKCVGSSLYLKTKCGVGYHLRMSVGGGYDAGGVTSLVKHHVPKAQLSRQQEAELTFTLPFESMDSFSGLFSELDRRPDLGIVNYGVSMTTLEDVFLRLEAEAEVDQAGNTNFLQSRGAGLHVLPGLCSRFLFSNFVLFLVYLGAVLVLSLATGNIQIHAPELQFGPDYLLRPNQSPRKYTTSLLVQNSSGRSVSLDKLMQGSHWLINNNENCGTGTVSLRFINIVSLTGRLLTDGVPPFQIKCRSTLRISGLVPSAYWCGLAAVDIPFYYLILTSMTTVLFSFHTTNMLTSSNLTAVVSLTQSHTQPLTHALTHTHARACTRTHTPTHMHPHSHPKIERNPEEAVSDDEDVQMERTRVKEALICQSCEEVCVVILNGTKWQVLTLMMKPACVCSGEVLGLLGPNGAGKSTIMHMLSADTDPTTGQVTPPISASLDNPLEHVGYCPQVSPLWPRITLMEHLEVYAAVKGLHGQDVPGIIKRVVNALELKDHLHKKAKDLSAGIKRKLCFALSMLGNPQIVLLDEPSTGMDPKSKQRMWRSIRAAFKNRQRGAVLTTHYMEEAEAVCDRVAIMVSGRLRCIGSIQHLKGKYGRGYSLEIKLREELAGLQPVTVLHNEILQIFPHAARQESFATLMVYKIPREDVTSLAKSFAQLESAKQSFNFEEYNFSQSTLEQVFMEFAKEQENEEDEMGSLSTTFQWQRLRQHDPVPGQHDPVPGQHDPVPGQHDPVPGQHDPVPGQHDSIVHQL